MSMLVIQLAPVPRGDAAPPAEPAALAWLLSPDGQSLTRQGTSAPADMPRADSVIVALPPAAVAWHRLLAPRAPAARMRAALGGVLEEQLLGDDADTHLALAPKVQPGAPLWVAAVDKRWLSAQLAALADAGLVVDRLVPMLAPVLGADGSTLAAAAPGAAAATAADVAIDAATAPTCHFFTRSDAAEHDAAWLAWADADGATCLPLTGTLARALLPGWQARGVRFSTTPAAAVAAERWLGEPVDVRGDAEQALAAVRTRWNLLQFDLAPRRRSSLALGRLARRGLAAEWRVARIGLVALLALQVLGLNGRAWQQERTLVRQRAEMETLLRSSHPQVRAVLDAPVQMQRETAALRTAAGVPGDEDFEPMLAAANRAWPDGMPPASQLRYETGRLILPATGWAPPQVQQMRERLKPAGLALDNAEGRLVIRRPDPGAATVAVSPDRPQDAAAGGAMARR